MVRGGPFHALAFPQFLEGLRRAMLLLCIIFSGRMSESGQSTKSLRDSPLRGGLPARAVTKGEIVDSGRRALS